MLLFLFACAGEVSPPPEPAPESPPDVLVVVMDTVRADRLGAYGYERRTSPQLDALAGAGVRFADVTAQGSWTWPSHATLFTGLYPWQHGAHLTLLGGSQEEQRNPFSALRTDVETFAERFQAAGYRTAAAASNPMLQPGWGLTRGFEQVEIKPGDDLATIAAAREILADPDPRPLLLFVNLFEAHGPYEPWTAEWIEPRRAELDPAVQPWLADYYVEGLGLVLNASGAIERDLTRDYAAGVAQIPPEGVSLIGDLYDAGVLREDMALNALLKAWGASGRAQGITAVTSDHGEYLAERGQIAHCRTLYPEVTGVPMVIAAPGRLPAGVTIEAPVELRALRPTLLELAGLEDAAEGSLLSLVSGAASAGPVLAAAWPHAGWIEEPGGLFAHGWRLYRDGDEALLTAHEMDGDRFGARASTAYYRLGDDPDMERDVAADHPERVEALLAVAAGAFTGAAETGAVEIDEATRGQLRALGYAE